MQHTLYLSVIKQKNANKNIVGNNQYSK